MKKIHLGKYRGREQDALNDLIDMFASRMKYRLSVKRQAGWIGWNNKGEMDRERLIERIVQNAKAGDMIDVANLAAMYWNLYSD